VDISNLQPNKAIPMLSSLSQVQEDTQRYVDDICAGVPYHFDVMGSNSDLPRIGKPRLEKIGARELTSYCGL
jgi:hypothetical protein